MYSTLEAHPDPGYVRRQLWTDSGELVRTEDMPVSDPDAWVFVTNYGALLSRLQAAMNANSNFLAINSPTNAQMAVQVKALTRQVQALIYLQLHAQLGLASIAGT